MNIIDQLSSPTFVGFFVCGTECTGNTLVIFVMWGFFNNKNFSVKIYLNFIYIIYKNFHLWQSINFRKNI